MSRAFSLLGVFIVSYYQMITTLSVLCMNDGLTEGSSEGLTIID